MKGKLFLLPTIIADETQKFVLPSLVTESVKSLSYFLCENVRTARRFVSSLKVHESIEALQFEVLDKDTPATSLAKLLSPLQNGINVGILSESGCPGIADPGAMAVAYAHQNQIQVVPLVGPSSILLALMASGLNGQKFAFHGYLPVEAKDAGNSIKVLEQESREKNQTQIFIETPYRNNSLLNHLLKSLRGDTKLCVAINLTSADEKIICQDINQWKKGLMTFEKVPAVFLFLAIK
ncbi:MAG: SAM-dependent methyltransferase [Cyclobacteriaceae bacterium]|nr:SAM-dependent methyltransferase [Cyclobacteriaceae bacterium]